MALRHILLAAVLWYGLPAAPLWSWGFDVHRLVNGHAVDLTPGPPQSVWPWAFPASPWTERLGPRGAPESPDR